MKKIQLNEMLDEISNKITPLWKNVKEKPFLQGLQFTTGAKPLTMDEFKSKLAGFGAFDVPFWAAKATFTFALSGWIEELTIKGSDRTVISLVGAVIEVFNYTENCYTIIVHENLNAHPSSGVDGGMSFIYEQNPTTEAYKQGWRVL